MATINIEMTGRLSLPKESDKFHPYTDTVYESGWEKKRLMFNATCGDNSHLLSVEAGAFSDGHGDVYSFTKGSVNEDGSRVKGQSVKIPFKDRLTSNLIPEIADFKKFIIDLEVNGRRYLLQNLAEKFEHGESATDEELKKANLETLESVKTELEKSNAKRHEFISEWDYVDFIKQMLDSNEYKDKKFFIRGNMVHSYSENTQKVYTSYVPTRIYLAADDAVESSTASMNLLFNSESFDDMSVEDTGKYYVKGWVMSYDNNRRADIPVETTIVIPIAPEDADEKAKKLVNAKCRKFKVDDDSIKEYGVVVDLINGAQKTELTDDMLTDEQKEDIECGLLTKEEIIRDMGGDVYGDRVREFRFSKVGKGFSGGVADTVYTAEDMVIKPLEKEDETTDLFDEDDEL